MAKHEQRPGSGSEEQGSKPESLCSPHRDAEILGDPVKRSHRKQVADAPIALQPRIRDAQERVQSRTELEKAVSAGDEPAMQRLYLPKLLDDYPRAQSCVAIAKLAPRVIPVLGRLGETSQSHRWRDFVREWDAHEAILFKRKSAERFAILAQTWKPKNQAWDQVLGLLGKPVSESGALSAAWNRLAQLGGHPESDSQRLQINALLDREKAWIEFRKVPRTSSATADAQLINAWRETAFKGWDLAERERPRVGQARQRLDAIQQIRQLASRPLEAGVEEAIIKLAGSVPADYKHELESRAQQAQQRVAALHQLQLAFKEPISDLKIVEIFRRLDQLQSSALLSATEHQRIAFAQKLVPLLERLKQIPPGYKIPQAPNWDPKLLANWQQDLLRDCHDARPWLKNYEEACQRRQALDKLQAAIAAGEKLRIAQAVSEPSLKGYPLPSNWYRVAKQARAEVKNIRAIVNALTHKDPSALWLLFDARIVRQNPTIFAPYQKQLLEWMRLAILPAEKMRLGFPVARGGVTPETDHRNAFRLCWNWPDPRFCDECLVAICPDKPRAGDDPRAATAHVRLPIDRRSYEDGGGSRLIHIEEGWLGSYVIVWAVVNLGFQTCYSEPLILGRVEEAAKPSRYRPGSLFG